MGGKGGRCVGLTTLLPSCADCFQIWKPQNSWNPQGLSRSATRIAAPLLTSILSRRTTTPGTFRCVLLCMTHKAHPTTCAYTEGRREVQLQPIRNPALEEWGSASRSGRFIPGKDALSIVQKAVMGSMAGLNEHRNSPPPKEFDPRTVQFAAWSLYRPSSPAHLLLTTQHTNKKFKIDTKDSGDMFLIGRSAFEKISDK